MAAGLEGTWKIDNSQNVGFDDFMAAQDFSKEVIEKFRNLDMTATHVQEKDGWKTTVTAGDYNEIINWKFGEEYETKDMLGNIAKVKPLLQGDTIVEEIISKTPKGDKKFMVTIKVNGDTTTRVMKDESGKTFTQVLRKC